MKNLMLTLLAVVVLGACTKPADNLSVMKTKKVYYRIKQVDKDGQVTYSPVVAVVEDVKREK